MWTQKRWVLTFPMTVPTSGGQDLSLEALTEELSVFAHWCLCPSLVVGILASLPGVPCALLLHRHELGRGCGHFPSYKAEAIYDGEAASPGVGRHGLHSRCSPTGFMNGSRPQFSPSVRCVMRLFPWRWGKSALKGLWYRLCTPYLLGVLCVAPLLAPLGKNFGVVCLGQEGRDPARYSPQLASSHPAPAEERSLAGIVLESGIGDSSLF